MTIALIVSAFIAGLLTFLAPCTLPLVPAYLSFISGSSAADLRDPSRTRSAKRRIFLNGIFFILGFSAVFILLGVFAASVGSIFGDIRVWVSRVGGALVVLFGLMMLDLMKIPFLSAEKGLRIKSPFARGTYRNSFLLGIIFGSGWTPCVGPVLGSILVLAGGAAGTAAEGAALLAVFSLGLAVPFLLIAASIGKASERIEKFSKYLRTVQNIGGVFLVILGLLLLTGNMGLLVSWGYRLFDFIHYDSLINYL